MRAASTASGACISGSIARPRAQRDRASGGGATTKYPRRAVESGDGRDVDGVDADARTNVAGRGGVDFVGMWIAMMVPMMLPSLIPCCGVRRGPVALVRWATPFVWTVVGLAIFPIVVALAAIELQQPAIARCRADSDAGHRRDRRVAAVHDMEIRQLAPLL